MASPEIIAELLRQKFQKDQGPSTMERGTAQLMQVMQGVSQGIAMYDAMKAIPAKYGTDVSIPGTSGSPAQAEIPSLTQTGTAFGSQITPRNPAAFGIPGSQIPQPQLPDMFSMLQPSAMSQAASAVPAQPATVQHIPGQLDLERVKTASEAMKNFQGTGPGNVMLQTLKGAGLDKMGTFEPTDTPVWDPVSKTLIHLPHGTKIDTSSEKLGMQQAGVDIAKQNLQLSKDRLALGYKEFLQRISENKDAKAVAELNKKMDYAVSIINNPKFQDDKTAIDFANSWIESVNTTGDVPKVMYKMAEVFGIPVPFTGKKKVVTGSDEGNGNDNAGNDQKITNYLTSKNAKDTPANREWARKQLGL